MTNKRASKIKAGPIRSPFGSDWNSALVAYPISDESWRASIGIVTPLSGLEREIVNWILNEMKSGTRRLFRAITFHEIQQLVEDSGMPSFKGKIQNKEYPFSEILSVAKSYLNENECLSEILLAKLIKYQILAWKFDDTKVQEPTPTTPPPKEKAKPAKLSSLENLEPLRQNRLKQKDGDGPRGDVIDDVPFGGPNMYILLFGFHNANIITALENVNVPLDTVIKVTLKTDSSGSSQSEIIDQSLSNEEIKLFQLPGSFETEKLYNQELAAFWAKFDSVFLDADLKSQLHNVIFQELDVQNTDVPSILGCADDQDSFRASLYTNLASLMYTVQDLKRQHQNWLKHIKFVHIPSYADQLEEFLDELRNELHCGPDDDIPSDVDVSLPHQKYYHQLMDSVPIECSTVPIILHCMIEQVVETATAKRFHLKNRRERTSAESLVTELDKMFQTCTEKYNPQLQFFPDVNSQNPFLVCYGDEIKELTHHLTEKPFDIENIIHSMIRSHPILKAVKEFPIVRMQQKYDQLTRYHNLLSLFKPGEFTVAEIGIALKKFTFESMNLQSADSQGIVKKASQSILPWDDPFLYGMDSKSSYSFAIMSPHIRTFSHGGETICSAGLSSGSVAVSASRTTVNLKHSQFCNSPSDIECECMLRKNIQKHSTREHRKSFVSLLKDKTDSRCQLVVSSQSTESHTFPFQFMRNLQDFNYLEFHPPNVFQQILYKALDVYHYVDIIHYKRDPCHLMTLHNPFNNEKHCRTLWKIKLNSDVNLRNFQLYVRNFISEWIHEEEIKYEELTVKKDQDASTKKISVDFTGQLAPSFSMAELIGEPEWVPQLILKSLKYKRAQQQAALISMRTSSVAQDLIFLDKDPVKKNRSVSERKRSKATQSHHVIRPTQFGHTQSQHGMRGRRSSQSVVESSMEEEKLPFQGYDIGNMILHISGTTNYLNPGQKARVCVEKYSYLQGRHRVKITIACEENYIFIHPAIKERCNAWPASLQVLLADGIRVNVEEQKTFEASDEAMTSKDIEKIHQHPVAVVVESLNRLLQSSKIKLDNEFTATSTVSSSAPEAEESKKTQITSKPVLTITLPTNLIIQIHPDVESGNFVIRQFYECVQLETEELCRTITLDGDVICTLKEDCSEILRPDGVILRTNWTMFSEQAQSESDKLTSDSDESFGKNIVADTKKGPFTKEDKERKLSGREASGYSMFSNERKVSELSTYSEVSVDVGYGPVFLKPTGPPWNVVTLNGRHFNLQLGLMNKVDFDDIYVIVAMDPATKDEYVVRDDGLQLISKPRHHLITHFPDGTRITSYYKKGQKLHAVTENVGKIRIEHPKFVTIISHPGEGNFELQLSREATLVVKKSGTYLLQQSNGNQFAYHPDGSLLFTPESTHDLLKYNHNCDKRLLNTFVICPHEETVLEAFDDTGQTFTVKANGFISVTGTPAVISEKNENLSRRYFIVHPDGSGSELLHDKQVEKIVQKCMENPLSSIESQILPNNTNIESLQLFIPLPGNWQDLWTSAYEMESIIPSGLTCKDLQPIPPLKERTDYVFGYNVGNELRSDKKKIQTAAWSSMFEYPLMWQLRNFIKFRKMNTEFRNAFEQKIRDFNRLVSEIGLQKLRGQPVDYRPLNEQKLAASLLALAKATGLPRQKKSTAKRARPPASVSINSKLNSRGNASRNNSLNRLNEDLRYNQQYLKVFKTTNYLPPFFQCQLGKEALIKIKEQVPPSKKAEPFDVGSTSKLKKKACDMEEKTPPLLKGHKQNELRRRSALKVAENSLDFRYVGNNVNMGITNRKQVAAARKSSQMKQPTTSLPKISEIRLPQWTNIEPFAPTKGEITRAKFLVRPREVNFGKLVEGQTCRHRVYLQNKGIESSAIKVRQPREDTGISVSCHPGLVHSGMQATLDVEIHALMPVRADNCSDGSIYYELEILTDLETIYLPVSATVTSGSESNSSHHLGHHVL